MGSIVARSDAASEEFLEPKTKTIHFIRHAQGVHYVAAEHNKAMYLIAEYFDAPLTELGLQQCLQAKEIARDQLKDVQLIITSPLTRTLQTTAAIFDGVLDAPRVALECVRERTGLHPCDSRRTVQDLSAQYPSVDFSFMSVNEDKLYEANRLWRESSSSVTLRCRELLRHLYDAPHTNIAVVSHSALLRHLLGQIVDVDDPGLAADFANCEIRTVQMFMAGVRVRVTRPT